jgi:hypothetical protein
LSAGPKFCSNCGEKIDYSKELEKCPKCGTDFSSSKYQSSPPVVGQQLPYKSPGTAALIAFIGGIFALPGIGHIYVGNVGRGIGILITGLILYALTVIMITSIGFLASFEQPDLSNDASAGIGALAGMLIFSIAYVILFIWQIFNARKLAKKFNEVVRQTQKEPW